MEIISHAGGEAGMTPSSLEQEARWWKTPELVKYTVFLAEDDSLDRNTILQTLQRSPYVHNVHWFDTGDRMLKHFVYEGYYSGTLIHSIPTLVLLDVSLPGTNGMDILKRLKENPLTCEIPVVMITGNMAEDAARTAYRLKANAFMVKPLHLDRVHEVMFTGWSWPTPPHGGL